VSVIAGLLLLARWSYFGAWLPNTYLAKSFIWSRAYVFSSLNFIRGAFLTDFRYIPLVLAVIGFLLYWRRPLAWKLAIMFGIGMVFMVWSGGHPRFFSPYLPFLYLLAGMPLAKLASRGGLTAFAVNLAFVALMSGTLFSAYGRAEYLYVGGRDPSGHSFQHVAVGKWLNENTDPDASIIAWEIGAIGLYSERRILDTQGLVDREVAQIFKDNEVNPYIFWIYPRKIRAVDAEIMQVLLDRDPDYVLLEYRGPVDGPVDTAQIIPPDAYVAVVEERGFDLVERFLMDPVIPKTFLLYRSPETGK